MGGKSKKIDASGISDAAMAGQSAMLGLGQRQIDFAQQQYDQFNPIYQQMAQQQMGLQNSYQEQANASNQMYSDSFMPMIQDYANQARNFNTDAYQQQLAQQASSDAAAAFGNTQASSARSMASMGVNPNSGRFAGLTHANDVQLAAQRGAAMTNTRAAARAEGERMTTNAIGLGDGLRNAGMQASQMAMNAGNNAGQMLMAPGQLVQNAYNSQGNMMQNAYSHGLSGQNMALGFQQQNNAAQAQERGALYSGIGSVVGTVGGMFAGPMGMAAGMKLGGMLGQKAAGTPAATGAAVTKASNIVGRR